MGLENFKMELENFKIGLVFRNGHTIILGEYTDAGKMGEDSIGVIQDPENMYGELPENKFEVVEIRKVMVNEKLSMNLRDICSYAMGENVRLERVVDVYKDNPVDFFNMINMLYGQIMKEVAH